ncbi:MAG: Saccharopine dehydrogenase binding protein, partial [Acidimicrobiaceae bacterium]|nr:Saccharopine dehydrogenase binding protein [Acidimicrobiaceae bacterium]
MARVLVIGPGDMGARIMAGLACTPGVHELVLAGVPAAAGEDAVGMVQSTTDVAARFIVADCTDQSAVEALLADGNTDVIVQCASLMSPWALVGRTDDVARAIGSAGLAVMLPMQLPVVRAVMSAVRATGFAG